MFDQALPPTPHAAQFLHQKRRSPCSRDDTDPYTCYTLAQIDLLLSQLLFHSYVSFNGVVYRQINGVAMGANFAGFVANLTLAYHELTFERQFALVINPPHPLMADPARQDLARAALSSFAHMMRYADDLFAILCYLLHSLLYTNQSWNGFHGIYPPCLLITPSRSSPLPAPLVPGFLLPIPFLDVLISPSLHPNAPFLSFSRSPYDKRTEPGFAALPIVRTTPYFSATVQHCKTNVIMCYLRRIAMRSDNFESFCFHALDVMRQLLAAHYPAPLLLDTARFFANYFSYLVPGVGIPISIFLGRLRPLLFLPPPPGPTAPRPPAPRTRPAPPPANAAPPTPGRTAFQQAFSIVYVTQIYPTLLARPPPPTP